MHPYLLLLVEPARAAGSLPISLLTMLVCITYQAFSIKAQRADDLYLLLSHLHYSYDLSDTNAEVGSALSNQSSVVDLHF